mmetsp:Transcript_2101/g.4781  ORF Transcript_2101/g.4781 Transcript_2101/m.4781 type:complete len:310 (-) Transcript_2101:63-992(-)
MNSPIASARCLRWPSVSLRCWTATLRRISSSTNDAFVELSSACSATSVLRFSSPSLNSLRNAASRDAIRCWWAADKLSRPTRSVCTRSLKSESPSWLSGGDTELFAVKLPREFFVCIIDTFHGLISAKRAFLATRIASSASFSAISESTCSSEELAMLKLFNDDVTKSSAALRFVRSPFRLSSIKVTFTWSLAACPRRAKVDCFRCSTWLAISELADVRASISSCCRCSCCLNSFCCRAADALLACLVAVRRCSRSPIWLFSFWKTLCVGSLSCESDGKSVTSAMQLENLAARTKKEAWQAARGIISLT